MIVKEFWFVWLAAILTLAIYSSLWSDNKIYRFIITVMIGLGVGYEFMIMWKQVLQPQWWDKVGDGYTALSRNNSKLLNINDFQDYSTFIYKLKNSERPIDAFLLANLTPETKQSVLDYNPTIDPSPDLKAKLTADVNQIIVNNSIYEPERFKDLKLTDSTKICLNTNQMGRTELNRTLLEEVYAEDIKPAPKWFNFLWILAAVPGSFWYFQFSRKHLWLSRITIGLMLGAGAGVVFKQQLLLNWPQITDTFRPVVARADTTPWAPLAGFALPDGLNKSTPVQSNQPGQYIISLRSSIGEKIDEKTAKADLPQITALTPMGSVVYSTPDNIMLNDNDTIKLTAQPKLNLGREFKNWVINGKNVYDRSITLTKADAGQCVAVYQAPLSLWKSLNNIIFVSTVVCVMVYFFFSFDHRIKPIKSAGNVGRWLLMISFGAFFGNTVMTRMAVFLERLQFLINDWLKPMFGG